MSPRISAIALLLAAPLVVACDDGGIEPSMLSEPRILAVRATPRHRVEGAPVTLTALTHGAGDRTWSSCPRPWLPAEPLACPEGATTLAVGPTATLLAGTSDPVYVRLDAGGVAFPAVLAVTPGDPAPHPEVTAIALDGDPAATEVRAGARVRVTPTVGGTLRGDVVTSFFTTAGRFDPWRTVGGAASTWEVPATPGPAEIWLVVRDDDGGVGWRNTSVTVIP